MRRYIMLVPFMLAACGGDFSGPPPLQPASFTVVEGAAQVDTVGRELKDVIAVRVVATDGATAVPNIPITWTPLDGGTVFAAVVSSGSDGIARQRYTLGTAAGVQRIRLTALDGETGAVLVDDTVTAEAVAGAAQQLVIHGPAVANFSDTVLIEYGYYDAHGNTTRACQDPDLVGWAWEDGLLGVGIDSTRGENGFIYTTDPATSWRIHPQAEDQGRYFIRAEASATTRDVNVRAFAPACTGTMTSELVLVRP